ncbi:MAG: hypothetical protein HXX11_18020 [Desulfuromonadales bacterium]|nr:hypothetical protein [Desulfuromonadales bacterium]
MSVEDYIFPNGFLDPGLQEWVVECHRLYPEWFALVNDINAFAIKVMTSLDVHDDEPQETLVAAMFIRALHTFQGAVLMAERGMMTPGRMLARCMLEVVFQLVAISKDKSHAQEYAQSDTIHKLKSFRKLQKLGGPEFSKQIHLDRAAELENEKAALGLKNSAQVEEWAKRAGLHNFYLTAYAHLSGAVHSSPSDLEEYLILDENGIIKELKWWSSDNDIDALFIMVIECMMIVIENTCHITTIETPEILETFNRRLKALVSESDKE